MNQSRLVWTSLALWAAVGTATIALACDGKTGASSASAVNASSSACPSAMAAHCTAAQAAACKASGMSCPAKGTSAAMFTLASASGGRCAGKGASAAGAGCPAHATGTATSASSSACKGEGLVKMAESNAHYDCDGCADMARCAQEISVAGGRVQVVPLKNGVMYVYTAETSVGVRAVQAAVAGRNERLAAWTTAGDQIRLCAKCKAMRGAAASGKLSREVVNIEGGCLTLMTSGDPAIVAQLHEMALTGSTRTKS